MPAAALCTPAIGDRCKNGSRIIRERKSDAQGIYGIMLRLWRYIVKIFKIIQCRSKEQSVGGKVDDRVSSPCPNTMLK